MTSRRWPRQILFWFWTRAGSSSVEGIASSWPGAASTASSTSSSSASTRRELFRWRRHKGRTGHPMGESQTPGMRLSVVIPCLNSADQLPVQLWALAREKWQGWWEVVIADNGSTDGTREVAEQFKDRLPRLLVVDASARRGAAYARNVAARSASGEAFLFLDADDEIAPGYLPAMADALAYHDFVAAYRDSESLNTGWVRMSRHTHPYEGVRTFFNFLPHAGGTRTGVRPPIFEAAGGCDHNP